MADTHGAELGKSLMPLAYARVLPPDFADGPAAEPGARSIGRVVTDPAVRGGGWGRRLVADLVAAFPGEPLTLNAQSHLGRFYSGFGFSPNGPRFDEDGNGPLRALLWERTYLRLQVSAPGLSRRRTP